jgi:hypothetical protein
VHQRDAWPTSCTQRCESGRHSNPRDKKDSCATPTQTHKGIAARRTDPRNRIAATLSKRTPHATAHETANNQHTVINGLWRGRNGVWTRHPAHLILEAQNDMTSSHMPLQKVFTTSPL